MNLSHNLFLLMFNLSQLHNKANIIKLFTEGMGEIFKPTSFIFSAKSENSKVFSIKIKTGNLSFGNLNISQFKKLPNESQILISNSVQMLATMLERLNLEQKLKEERDTFKRVSEERFVNLKSNIIKLKQSRSASLNLIEDLSDENEKRKLSETRLKESEERSRSVAQTAVDAIITINSAGIIMTWNKAAKKIFGYSSKEMVNQNLSKIIPKKFIKGHNAGIKRVNEGGKKNTIGKIIELSALRKNKTEFSVEISLSNWETNNKKYYTGIIRDITVRKKAELLLLKTNAKLIAAKEKAEESDRLKSAFLTNMSHEIRTPMNGILGFSSLLKEPGLSGAKQQKYIEIIEKSGNRMLNTINDIIDISKIDSEQMLVLIEDADISEQLIDLFHFFEPQCNEKGLMLNLDSSFKLEHILIQTDKLKFNSIFTNLIKNAIKYTDAGEISIGCIKKEKHIEFHVKDTGIGVPAGRQQAIFNRFEQADIEDKRAFQGSGLGLAIVKAYVEMLGGEIWLNSEENKGTTFFFTLPFKNKKNSISKTIKNQTEEINILKKTENATRKLKILIAEDDEASSMYLSTILESFNCEILYSSNGAEAVEMYQNNRDIDIILMDLKMPILDGYKATRKIRELNKSVFIIAQTAYSLAGDEDKAIQAGCNAYLFKPIQKEKLIGLMNTFIKKKC
ncbi:MAG: hypothetical protein COC22_00675 [Flavobacteriaceae bacterium]|nr:MAG: hypothetical protein COC22_00675 [Flavobacteriaceae bacterium]